MRIMIDFFKEVGEFLKVIFKVIGGFLKWTYKHNAWILGCILVLNFFVFVWVGINKVSMSLRNDTG
jgi:hypothetical protein